MPETTFEDPLFTFLKQLVKEKKEIEILKMLFDEQEENVVIEKMIGFKANEEEQ